MSTERHRELVRRFYEEVVNAGDADRIGDCISPGLIEIHDGVVYESGIDGMKAHVLGGRQT